jgi:hypothetical protein
MRIAVLVLVLAGCGTQWTIEDRAADLLTVQPRAERAGTAVRAIDEDGKVAWLRGDTVDVTWEPPNYQGRRRVYQRTDRKTLAWGGLLVAVGATLWSSGAFVWSAEANQFYECEISLHRLPPGLTCEDSVTGPALVGVGLGVTLAGFAVMIAASRRPTQVMAPR